MKVSVDRRRLRARMIEEDKNSLIKALKQDDPKAAKQALTGMSGDDLGLTHKEFSELTNEIDFASRQKKGYGDIAMDAARQILGIEGKDTKQSTATHNPVTNQPWTSGAVKQPTYKSGTLAHDLDSFADAVKSLSPTDSSDLYHTIVSGEEEDLNKFPHIESFAKKLHSKAHNFNDKEMDNLSDFFEMLLDSNIAEEDKEWIEKISERLFGY